MEVMLIFLLSFFFYMWIKLISFEAIFVPLPRSTIRKMLELAKVKSSDVLYDLGAGDGRVLIMATKEYDCKSIGIERSSLVAALCRYNVKKSGLKEKIKLIEGNYFDVNLSKATIITAYLSQKQNNLLVPKLKRELKKGTRIVSASHTFPGLRRMKKIRTGHFYTYLYKI